MDFLLWLSFVCVGMLLGVALIQNRRIGLIIAALLQQQEMIDNQDKRIKAHINMLESLEHDVTKGATCSSMLAKNIVPPYIDTDLLKREMSCREVFYRK